MSSGGNGRIVKLAGVAILSLILLACTAAILLRGVNSAEYAGLNRYQGSDARLAASPASGRVVFFGDSITDGWDLALSFPGKPYVNRGINGQTTSQLLLRFHQDVVNLQPESVVILAGVNDVSLDAQLQEIENNYAAMAEMARANHIQVYFGSILPVAGSRSRHGSKPIVSLNQWLRDYCSKHGISYVDYWQRLADSKGQLPNQFSADGLHPNSAGYAVMTAVLERELTKQ